MNHPYLATVCKKLGVDYAPALTGFEPRSGRSVPRIQVGGRLPGPPVSGGDEYAVCLFTMQTRHTGGSCVRLCTSCPALYSRPHTHAPPHAHHQGVVVCAEHAEAVMEAYAEMQR